MCYRMLLLLLMLPGRLFLLFPMPIAAAKVHDEGKVAAVLAGRSCRTGSGLSLILRGSRKQGEMHLTWREARGHFDTFDSTR